MTLTVPLQWVAYPAAAILCYFSCFKGPPIFDDLEVLETANALKWKWKYVRGSHRVLTLLSYAVQKLWPNTFRSLHVANALLHALVGMVVAQIATQLGSDEASAFFAGLLFTVHPFAANTVAYLSGRAAILCSLFGFLAVWALLTPGQTHWAMLFLGMTLICKEDGLGFGPLLGAVAVLRGEWVFAAVLGLAGIGLIAWQWPQFKLYLKGNGDAMMRTIGLPVSLPQPQHGYTVLVETLIRLPLWTLGAGLSPYHGSGVKVSPLYRAAIVLILSFIYSLLFWLHPIPTLSLLLGPWTVYLVCRVPDQICEYRSYSSLAGMALFGGLYIKDAAAGSGILLTAAILTAYHAYPWSKETRMWARASTAYSGDPSRAYGELGAHYKLQGDGFRAEMALRDAVRINPGFGPALNNLAWVLWDKQAQFPEKAPALQAESLTIMESCVQHCPEYALGWQDLGKLYDAAGKSPALADDCYRQALALEPRMVYSVNRLGLTAFRAKDFAAAAAQFDRANELQPGHFEFVYNRAVVWKHTGEPGKAMELFKKLPQPTPITGSMIPLEFAQ